jgi:hypothetical protein
MKKQFYTSDIHGVCQQCGKDWRGDNFFDLYRQEIPQDEVSDEELRTAILHRHATEYQSKLVEFTSIDGSQTIHICPFCCATFEVLTAEKK